MNDLTPKQYEVLKTFNKEQPRITILTGAKRSGKTFLNYLETIFIYLVEKRQTVGRR